MRFIKGFRNRLNFGFESIDIGSLKKKKKKFEGNNVWEI